MMRKSRHKMPLTPPRRVLEVLPGDAISLRQHLGPEPDRPFGGTRLVDFAVVSVAHRLWRDRFKTGRVVGDDHDLIAAFQLLHRLDRFQHRIWAYLATYVDPHLLQSFTQSSE